MSPADATLEFGTVVVVGGGCYGSQYVRQLRRARVAGRVRFDRLVVVDQLPVCALAQQRAKDPTGASDLSVADGWKGIEIEIAEWRTFFDRWLGEMTADPRAHERDAIVPSPLMPHLLFEWLLKRARSEAGTELPVVTPTEFAGVPWQREGADGTRYVSFATWMCPINCIEPAKCPHTKGPRDWSMHLTLPTASATAVALLPVIHQTFGVGMIRAADVMSAHELVQREVAAGRPVRVATASHCHGAVAQIGA